MDNCAIVEGCKTVFDLVLSDMPKFESEDEEDLQPSYSLSRILLLASIGIARNIRECHIRVSGYVKANGGCTSYKYVKIFFKAVGGIRYFNISLFR
jgi:hypothetical protein